MKSLRANVLPTALAATVVIATLLTGLLTLWDHSERLSARADRLRQAHADVESAFMLYRLRADDPALTAREGYQLYDSLPISRVFVRVQPWGLYRVVQVLTADSAASACRLYGAEPEAANTLYYADRSGSVTLAGRTVLQGMLRLPRNGPVYGRAGADLFRGPQVPRTSILRSNAALPAPQPEALSQLAALLSGPNMPSTTLPQRAFRSFRQEEPALFRLGEAEIGDCTLRGKIVLYADEVRIDSTCRLEHPIVVARKIVVGSGARITAQLFARDSAIVSPRAVLAYPSGLFAGAYAEIGEHDRIDGYVIVRDTVRRRKVSANFRQARTARLRGLVRIDGIAQVQGIVSGSLCIRQAAYFSDEGYYLDMLYDATVLENPETAHPFWLAAPCRKEAAWLD